MTAMLASDAVSDDRRRTANAGSRSGPEAAIQDAHAMTDLGFTNVTSTVMATRGERLVLMRARYFGPDGDAAAFYTEVLNLVEIDADNRIVGVSGSTPTTSTPLSPSLMLDTSRARGPPTRTYGPSSSVASPRCAGTSCRRPRPTV